MAVLRLSHLVATRAGLHRYEFVDPVGGLVLPRSSGIDSLTTAVTFESDTIIEVTGGVPEVLDPLVHDLASGPLPAGPWPFDLTPLVRRGDRCVLCDPAALVIGLRHRLVLMAIEAGEDRALAETLTWLGISDDQSGWTAFGRMVVDAPVMSPYVAQCPLPVVTAAQLASEFDTSGAPPSQDWPRVLVLHRRNSGVRRDRALEGFPTRKRYDRDEYPPAVGRATWRTDVAYVRSGENRSHGSSLGAQLRPFCAGTRFRYVFF